MKWELIAVALFWLVYGPVSFAIWGSTSSHLSSLVAILTAGIVFTATFLGGRLLMQHLKAKKYKALIEEKMDILDQLIEDETVQKGGKKSFGTSEAMPPAEPEADSEETEEVLEEKASAPQIQESLD